MRKLKVMAVAALVAAAQFFGAGPAFCQTLPTVDPNDYSRMMQAVGAVDTQAVAGQAAQPQQTAAALVDDGEDSWEALVTAVSGKVLVEVPEKHGKWMAVKRGMPLRSSDALKTGASASVEISFDGGQGIISLGANAQLALDSLSSDNASITLKAGRILALMKGLLKLNRNFVVVTPNAVCAVRGTEFAVEYLRDSGSTVAGVFDDGQIGVSASDPANDREILLTRNQEIEVSSGAASRLDIREISRFANRKKSAALLEKRAVLAHKGWRRMSIQKRREVRLQYVRESAVRSRAPQQIPRMKLLDQRSRHQRDLDSGNSGPAPAAPQPLFNTVPPRQDDYRR